MVSLSCEVLETDMVVARGGCWLSGSHREGRVELVLKSFDRKRDGGSLSSR